MAADGFHYNVPQALGDIDDAARMVAQIRTMADEVYDIFQKIQSVWDGGAPGAVQARHNAIHQIFEGIVDDLEKTNKGAGEHVEGMGALDSALANQITG